MLLFNYLGVGIWNWLIFYNLISYNVLLQVLRVIPILLVEMSIAKLQRKKGF
jgi:hypothetical protein